MDLAGGKITWKAGSLNGGAGFTDGLGGDALAPDHAGPGGFGGVGGNGGTGSASAGRTPGNMGNGNQNGAPIRFDFVGLSRGLGGGAGGGQGGSNDVDDLGGTGGNGGGCGLIQTAEMIWNGGSVDVSGGDGQDASNTNTGGGGGGGGGTFSLITLRERGTRSAALDGGAGGQGNGSGLPGEAGSPGLAKYFIGG